MVSVETIKDLSPIEGADRIELATVKGWKVVTQKGLYQPGDEALYFEVDSFLPIEYPQFAHLEPRGVKVMDGVTGHVLKTIKLRGQISQGMLVPLSEFPDGLPQIEKWEKPVPSYVEGQVAGDFPYGWCPKTDAERIQNLDHAIGKILSNRWIATEKIDGTSTTFINDSGQLRVTSRNCEILPPSIRFDIAESLGILEILPEGYALQGELFGEGVQGNPLRIKGKDFRAFALYRQSENGPEHVPFEQWPASLVHLHVPVYALELPETVEGMLVQADSLMSEINPQRRAEGIVWQSDRVHDFLGYRGGFKVLSNKYLLKNQDS